MSLSAEAKVHIKESKKIFIFLHSAKSGGSSFWKSLNNEATNNKNIAVCNIYHRSQVLFSKPTDINQKKSLKLLIDSFMFNRKKILLVHYHGLGYGIDQLFQNDLKRTYILFLRDSEDRLKSAYNWYVQTQLWKSSARSQKDKIMNFFGNFLSKGYNYILPSVFNMDGKSHELSSIAEEKILPIYMNDYNQMNHSNSLDRLLRELEIGILKPVHFIPKPKKITNKIIKSQAIEDPFSEKEHKYFFDRIEIEINKESEYNKKVMEIFGNNL